MPTINHGNLIDLTDLADLARECGEVLEDPEEYDAEEVSEAADTLQELAKYVWDKGYNNVKDNDADDIADALDYLSRDSNPLIDSDHFTDYIREYTEEVDREALESLPEYIRYAIDWHEVAEALQVDYSSYKLDGVDYYQR
jgi:hypothetical protein